MNDPVELDRNFVEAMIGKLEEAYEAEGQFKDTKISEVLVHMKIETSDKRYSELLREKMQEAESKGDAE